MCIFLLECACVCHCMCTKVWSSPRRKIPLLGIAHPVMGKYFQVLEVDEYTLYSFYQYVFLIFLVFLLYK